MTLLTEEKAKEKWCPLDKGSYTDRHIGGPQPYCIASACMAWRWSTEGWAISFPDEAHAVFTVPRDGTARGFCGAFGKVSP